MFSTHSTVAVSLALLSFIPTSLTAPASSTFVLPTDGGKNITFALNIPSASEDLYFHLSGPTSSSWIAIGAGREMKDSLMFLVYQNQHGSNLTLSPRICTGHTEPVFEPSLHVDVLPGSGIFHNTYVLNAKCANCRSWKGGSLNLRSTAQPWIYGLGPGVPIKSNSKSVSIERHSEYGIFSINMLQATGSPGTPTPTLKSSGATENGSPTQDSNWTSIIHAAIMSVAFVLLMPLGVILLRIFERVRWHWVNQALAAGGALLASGIGIYLSSMYTKSTGYTSAHQLLGLAVSVLLLLQLFLGFWHHRLYKATQRTTVYASVHRYLGQVTISAGIINGGIGLAWSRASTGIIVGYTAVVAVVALLTVGTLAWKRWRRAPKAGYQRRSLPRQDLNVEGQWDSSRSQSDISLTRYAHAPGTIERNGVPGGVSPM